MIGSEAVIGWVTSAGVEVVQSYTLKDKVPSQIIVNPDVNITSVSAIEVDGYTTMKFTRKITGTNSGNIVLIVTGSGVSNNHMVVAYGNSDFLSQHDPTSRVEGITINYLTGTSTATVDPLRYIHGIIMFTSWGVILPMGGFLARYRNEKNCPWWPTHQNLQISGIILSTGGFILGFCMVDAHFVVGGNIYHACIACIITFFALIQFIFGLARPHFPEGYKKSDNKPEHKKPTCAQACRCESDTEYTPQRLIWERKHRWLGRFLFMAAACNIGIGASLLLGIDTGIAALFYIYLAYLLSQVITVIAMDTKYKKWMCCQDPKESSGKMDVYLDDEDKKDGDDDD